MLRAAIPFDGGAQHPHLQVIFGQRELGNHWPK
jgi:hypothetical protein